MDLYSLNMDVIGFLKNDFSQCFTTRETLGVKPIDYQERMKTRKAISFRVISIRNSNLSRSVSEMRYTLNV